MRKWIRWGIYAFCAAILIFMVQSQLLDKNSWSTWNLPLTGKVIVVDPGHGGPDSGARGAGEIFEKDIALNIALSLRDYLQEAGALVIMTRETDKDLAGEEARQQGRRQVTDLRARTEVVNTSDADLFISVHLNSIPSSRWRGAQVLYHPAIEENERISKFIQDAIQSNLENTDRSAKSINTLYMLRRAEIPGVLVEVGFLSNPSERDLLNTEPYQNKVAASIYQGILRYYTDEPAPSS
jgi:N-acetylmuramoyl-L-alanine amidase